ncbi:MAG: bifunctional 4'-phosphopantothenoylcysteine decarboxylase/phosphopantothenoylcysteine synthetase, partial [Candidatus Omnitrophica bacterium]|nr:bifunctional 4'-phosphopantothenoylcysteine decarboxylase/phosphopantothenoylcysteine synthetase [Candidatus Omnitrophota bacterium]
TANIIGKLANGIADDLLTCIALATKAPILIAPAMNTNMYQNKIVQENCRKLKKYGMQFIDPVRGKLACGTTGKGHIADEATIVKSVLRTIK